MSAHRTRGVFVPLPEVEAHLACGWSIVDDLMVRDGSGAVRLLGMDEVVLMAPRPDLSDRGHEKPAASESEAA
ncbi:hypothetical protein [Pseudorhodoplanes sp.]|uniref:hypothetical protein n=1 Tax=Pseudorhodoplanes sp. TaxID=1934341 RepID=UPI003D14F408